MATYRKQLQDKDGNVIIPAVSVQTADIENGAVTADKIDLTTSNASTYVLNNINLGTSQTLLASITAPSAGTYVVIAGGYYGASGTAITSLSQRISVNGTEKSFAQNSESYLGSNQYNLGFKFVMWTGSVNAGDTIQYYAYKGGGTLTAGKVTLAAFRVA